MKAQELLEASHLSAAITEITQQVKSHPSDSRLRTFLFETLCFAGEYDRAERQLDVIGHQNESAGIGVEVYRQLIKAEQARERLFKSGVRPTFLTKPPVYTDLHLEAMDRLREGHGAEACDVLERAGAQLGPLKGCFNGQPFTSFRDSDDIVGPILECFVSGAYVWLPLEQIRKLTIGQPKHLRDLLWIQATVELGDLPPGDIFLPVLYQGSQHEDNDQIKLGRMTDWRAVAEGIVVGVGQRTFLADGEEKAILEMRELEVTVG